MLYILAPISDFIWDSVGYCIIFYKLKMYKVQYLKWIVEEVWVNLSKGFKFLEKDIIKIVLLFFKRRTLRYAHETSIKK